MKKWIGIPNIPLTEQTSATKLLLDVIDRQQGMINDLIADIDILKEEVKRLKGHKGKPKIKPSKMDKDKSNSAPKKRAGSVKRSKTVALTIHEEETISVNDLPDGSR